MSNLSGRMRIACEFLLVCVAILIESDILVLSLRTRISMPPSGIKGHKLKALIRAQRFRARNKIVKWFKNVLARRKACKARFSCLIEYFLQIITIYMQLMAAFRYFDRLESEMPPEAFDDLTRKVLRALAPRLGERAGILDDTLQVVHYFDILS